MSMLYHFFLLRNNAVSLILNTYNGSHWKIITVLAKYITCFLKIVGSVIDVAIIIIIIFMKCDYYYLSLYVICLPIWPNEHVRASILVLLKSCIIEKDTTFTHFISKLLHISASKIMYNLVYLSTSYSNHAYIHGYCSTCI